MDPQIMNLFTTLEASLLKLTTDVSLFINSPAISCFIENKDIHTKVELRKSHHYLDSSKYLTLDIKAMSIGNAFKSVGVGVKLIKIIKDSNPYPVTFIYNLVDEPMCAYLLRRNWKKVYNTNNLYTANNDTTASL